jgi:hypothetical protein
MGGKGNLSGEGETAVIGACRAVRRRADHLPPMGPAGAQ